MQFIHNMKNKKNQEVSDLKPIISKLNFAINILEEKVAREYGLTLNEVRSKKIEIINSQLIIK